MSNKRIILNIISSVAPYSLTIKNGNNIIETQTINRKNTQILICTHCHQLELIASIDSQIIRRSICLTNNKCQTINIPLDFIIFPPLEALNIFTLIDANYNLPVSEATLSFM